MCHFSFPVFVCFPVLFLCTPVTHWLITACVFKSVFSPHSPLVRLFDKHFVGLFLQGVWLFALGLLSNAILRANTQAEPNWQYVTHQRECLWVQCGTVHSGCCDFSSSWEKRQCHSHFFSVFSGHVAAILKTFATLYCIDTPVLWKSNYSTGEIVIVLITVLLALS